MNLKLRLQGPPLPADDHRRFRLPTTWDEYTKPKNEFNHEHVTPLVTKPMGCLMTIPLCLCKRSYVYHFLCLPFIYYSPYVHTIRTDFFTNSDWEKITKSKLIQTRTSTDPEHYTQEEEPRTQGQDQPEHVPPQRCENYAVVTLFFLNFPYLLQDLLS